MWEEVKDKLASNGLSLSGGQQQRLCIARTVAVKPEVILFDEPCSALDPISTAKIEELIDELKKDYTIVIVTHNMQQAARVSDFTAFMYLGDARRVRPDPDDLHLAQRPAHAGLHHRPVRISAAALRRQTARPRSRTCSRTRSPPTMPISRRWTSSSARWQAAPRPRSRTRRRRCSTGDVQLAQQVIAGDAAIDLLQHNIEEKAISTIATRQPVAIDLRQIVSTIRIASDLERIGDLAKNVAKRVIAIGRAAGLRQGRVRALRRWRRACASSSKACSGAYRQRDDGAALEVWRSDGAIDTLHTSLFRELLTYMMEDPRSIGFCAHLLFCAKNLERIGDHATNIAETTHYMITGDMLSGERPKADETSGVDPSWGSNAT